MRGKSDGPRTPDPGPVGTAVDGSDSGSGDALVTGVVSCDSSSVAGPVAAALVPSSAAGPSGSSSLSVAVPASSPAPSVSGSFSQIQTIQDMRMEDPSFCIAFDSEFYYDSGQRFILSWQFSFICPDDPGVVVEMIVFSERRRCLRFSLILNYVIEHYGLFSAFGCGDPAGLPFYGTRRWVVPVRKRGGAVGSKSFDKFSDAVASCCDPAVQKALLDKGSGYKAEFDYVTGPNGHAYRVALNAVNDYAIGYENVYTEANRSALPVTLICHTGSADLTTLDFGSQYEKDIMLRVSQVQGGLVTLSEYTMHNPTLGKYYNFYPVRVSVRDTMCFAPAGQKKLEDLGRVLKIPKLDVPAPYSKSDMLTYMMGDPVGFADYAVNDALIALLYCHELWGLNTAMPVTVSSASGKAAVPVIAEYFGLDRKDRAGFDRLFRGLHRVKRGRVPRHDGRFGFLQNTSLEPVSPDAELVQLFAKNAYKGGYNGSIKIGFFPDTTYDYDLENAYPTCMSLVPDIDWDDCIAFEVRNQKLTPTLVRSPFDPVFAVVDFEFPASVRFPSIPQTVDGSMVYTRTGRNVYASAPELYLALQLGADVTVKRLFMGNIRVQADGTPSHSLLAVVKQFVEDRTFAQKVYGKKSLLDLLLKIAVNSIYGKTAQDVIDKTTWSAMKEAMVDIGGSSVTSPVHACLTTAGVRAVLLAAMNQLADLGYTVYSVTTDGFISDAPASVLVALDLYGFTRLFQAARVALTGDPTMWQVKHEQSDLVNLTTRGNASLNDGSQGGLPGVLAHNSFVTGEVPDSPEDRLAFVKAVLERTGRVSCVNKSFALFKDMARRNNRIDFCVRDQERQLSMDFDLKRMPVESSFYTANPFVDGDVKEIACFDTLPYETVEDYERYKRIGRGCVVLRTVIDWSVFFRRLAGGSVVTSVVDPDWAKLRSAVMAYRLGVPLDFLGGEIASIPVLDSPLLTVEQKLRWISGFNAGKKEFTESDWKNARRQNRINSMLPEALYQDVLVAMMSWTTLDGSPLENDPDGWKVVCDTVMVAGVGIGLD